VLYIGDTGIFEENINVLIVILSTALGAIIGGLIDLDGLVNKLGGKIEKRFNKKGGNTKVAEGFVTATLLFCVGAMAVNGSIADAMGVPDILIAKAIIDGFACFMMATSFGIGCAFSAFAVLIYQGLLTVGGLLLFTSVPAATLSYVSITGSVVIMLIGTNLLGITKVKTANMIPAVFLPFLLAPIVDLLF
jgi:uncharacterized membrane protein YqgA involved in biofilm formation